MKYYINGWEESRSYFLSFGFTKNEYERMINGEIIKRERTETDFNEFWIVKEEQ